MFWIISHAKGSCDDLIVDKTKWTGNLGAKLKISTPMDISSFTITFATDIPLKSITVDNLYNLSCLFMNCFSSGMEM